MLFRLGNVTCLLDVTPSNSVFALELGDNEGQEKVRTWTP